jgi:hypothetical protein
MSFTSIMRAVQLVGLALMLTTCTAESTLKSLAEQFPQRKAELNELKDLMLALSDSGKNFRFLASRVTGEKDDLVDFFDKEGRVPISKALDSTFRPRRDQLTRVQALIHTAGIDYVSVDKERRAVWVTLEGGGVLAADKGYLYAGRGEIASFHLQRVLPIPSESNWYAFVD